MPTRLGSGSRPHSFTSFDNNLPMKTANQGVFFLEPFADAPQSPYAPRASYSSCAVTSQQHVCDCPTGLFRHYCKGRDLIFGVRLRVWPPEIREFFGENIGAGANEKMNANADGGDRVHC